MPGSGSNPDADGHCSEMHLVSDALAEYEGYFDGASVALQGDAPPGPVEEGRSEVLLPTEAKEKVMAGGGSS